MPIINLEGERESTTTGSEQYGKKIIEYLNEMGYSLEKDSNIHGIFQDKIFRRPSLDGVRETVVEVKNTKLSLSDKDFLSELGKYFLLYEAQKDENKFFMKIFVKQLANFSKWKKIFDILKYQKNESKKLFSHISKAMNDDELNKMLQHDFPTFEKFIKKIEIVSVSYDKLVQWIDKLKQEKLFDKDELILKEDANIEYTNDPIIGNIIPIKQIPQKLLIGEVDNSSKYWGFWDANEYVLYKEQLFSFKKIPPHIKGMLKNDVKVQDIDKLGFDEDEMNDIKKRLAKSFIISKAANAGYYYNRKLNCIYFPHKDVKIKFNKIGDIFGRKKRIVSKVFYKNEDEKEVNFVEHRALKFRIIQIEDSLYFVYNFFRLFTEDGKKIITGDYARRLHMKFRPTKAFNNIIKSKLDFLVTLLRLNSKDLLHNHYVRFEKPISLMVPCKPLSGEIFDEIVTDINYDWEESDDSEL